MQTLKTWMPAVAGMFFLGLGAGLIGIYGFFVEPLSREFGVGVAVLNLGPVALLLIPGVASPLIGPLVDRLPIRRIILVGICIAMGSLLAISRAPTLPLAALGFALFVVGAVMYGPVVVNGLMVKLYPGREARALSIAAIGISFATVTLPPATGALLAVLDWREALAGLAAALLVILWLVALAAVPAGVVGVPAGGHVPAGGTIYRQPAFWLIGLCMAVGLNATIVAAISYPVHFASEGFSVAQAGMFLSFSGASGFVGKVGVAWLGDAIRNRAKWLAAGILALQVLGFSLLLVAEGASAAIVAMCVLGFSSGAFLPIHPFLNSCYFDAARIGQVTGAQMPLFLPFGLVGAPLAGYVYDRTGSYELVLIGLIAAVCTAVILALRLPAPPATRHSLSINSLKQ